MAPTVDSSSRVSLAWQPPIETDRNGVIYGYHVRLYVAASPQTLVQEFDAGLQETFSVQRLRPDTGYLFTVAAYTLAGVGVFCEPVGARTLEDKPDGPVTAVAAIAVNSTAVKLSWEAPEEYVRNGVLVKYLIRLVSEERAFEVTADNDRATQSLVIGSLPPYTTVMVRPAA